MTETAMMSKTQRNIVNCISGFIAEHGFSPTIREIQLFLDTSRVLRCIFRCIS